MSVINIAAESLPQVELMHAVITQTPVNLGDKALRKGVVFKNSGPGEITIRRINETSGGYVIGPGEMTERIPIDNLNKVAIVASESSTLSWMGA